MMAVPNATASRHEIVNSGLYRVPTMAALADLLHWRKTPSALRALCNRDDNWDEFEQERPGKKPRKIQAPKPGAKIIQRRLNELLKRIKPPAYLHSGTPGRSYLTNSAEHMHERGATATVDISDFYPSISKKRVFMLFREVFACSPDVADALANLMCCDGHLATGSPASALVSFWSCKDMFDGIAERVANLGGRFTLYVDDITLTAMKVGHGDHRFLERHMAKYGFRVSKGKSRIYRAEKPKQITGRVVRSGVSRAPNKQHLKMRDATRLAESNEATKKDIRSAIGKLQHVGLLDKQRAEKLKQRAQKMRTMLAQGQDSANSK